MYTKLLLDDNWWCLKTPRLLVDVVGAGRLLALLEAPGDLEALAGVAEVCLRAGGLTHLPGHILTHLAPWVTADLARIKYLSAICVETQLLVLGDQLWGQSCGGRRNVKQHENYLCVYLLGESLAYLWVWLSVADCSPNFNPPTNLKSFVFPISHSSLYYINLTFLGLQISLVGSLAQCWAGSVAISQVLIPVKNLVPLVSSVTTLVLGTL